ASCAILRYFVGVSRDSSSRFSVDLPATGAQSERHASSLPARTDITASWRRSSWSLRSSYPSAMPNTRWPTSVATVCSIYRPSRPSRKQPPNQLTGPIALSAPPNSNPPASDVTAPPSNSATTGRPSTGVNSLGFALHSVCIGEPLCVVIGAKALAAGDLGRNFFAGGILESAFL